MNNCIVCRDGTLKFTGEKTEIMPPPPGTKWAPLPIKVYYYECSNCGSIYKQKNNESLVLVEEKPYVEDLAWNYLDSPSSELMYKLVKLSGAVIPSLLQTLVHIYRENGKQRSNLLRLSKTTVDEEIERINRSVLEPCVELLSKVDESAQLRLCVALGEKEPNIQKVSALLLNLLNNPSDNIMNEVRKRLTTTKFTDASTLLLVKSFLYYFGTSPQDKLWLEEEARIQHLDHGLLHTRAMQSASLELSGWSSSQLLQVAPTHSSRRISSSDIFGRVVVSAGAGFVTYALAPLGMFGTEGGGVVYGLLIGLAIEGCFWLMSKVAIRSLDKMFIRAILGSVIGIVFAGLHLSIFFPDSNPLYNPGYWYISRFLLLGDAAIGLIGGLIQITYTD